MKGGSPEQCYLWRTLTPASSAFKRMNVHCYSVLIALFSTHVDVKDPPPIQPGNEAKTFICWYQLVDTVRSLGLGLSPHPVFFEERSWSLVSFITELLTLCVCV